MKHFFKSNFLSYAMTSAFILSTVLLTSCGGGASDSGGSSGGGNAGGGGNANPTKPVLNSIGNKTIAAGSSTLSFSVSATDPNGLVTILSSDGSVGSGLNPYTETGSTATFNPNSGSFTWNITSVVEGEYFVQFSVMNTNAETDSEIVRITVQSQFILGAQKYNSDCQRCHGTAGVGGSQTLIQCIDSATFFEKINGGSMTQYATQWSAPDKNAVLFYLNNVNPVNCL